MKAERIWGTWDARRPAEMLHLSSGIRITPLVYAGSIGKASLLPPSSVKLGTHLPDAGLVELALSHAGTELHWNWHKPSSRIVHGSWKASKHGEWGLRFWVSLVLSSDEDGEWSHSGDTASFRSASGILSVITGRKPLLVTAHDSVEAVAREFETHGYWYLKSRASKGKVLALRFNLDEMPECAFVAGFGKGLREALVATPPEADRKSPLAAVRDIVAWNSTWDSVNRRPYTSCTRNWDTGKFGGFGIWLTDTAVNALLLSTFDAEMAAENLAALRAHQTRAGNFPCLVTGHDDWSDRTQPPIVSLLVWLIYLRDGNREWLKTNYQAVARNHAWWWRQRDGNGNGILEYGSSDVGNGLYVGTKLAAKDESFMDNSPMHDEARWQESSRTLDMEDVGLNSLITLDAEILGLMARELGREKESQAHIQCAERHRLRVATHFWDDRRKVFANRLWSGKFADAVTPTSFYPLLCGAASPAQAKAMAAKLNDPKWFGGKFGLPSVARHHPSIADNVYWRGRIWPILNWLTWLGLKRQKAWAAADSVVERGNRLFSPAWRQRTAPENFNAFHGAGLDQPDTDDFYSWTALLPYLESSRIVDIDPWSGWIAINAGPDARLGPMRSPWGMVTAERAKGRFRLVDQKSRVIFETRKKGRQPITADCRG